MTIDTGKRIAERENVAWRRRLLVFGESIRSDFGNPQALTWRALMRSLTRAGHDVVFIEPRRGDSLTSLLRHRGFGPLRQFAARFPDIQYRTLDLPGGRELAIWLARELALIDAVVVLDDASPEIRTIVDDYDEPGLIRFTTNARSEASVPSAATSVRMAPIGETTDDLDGDILRIGPAIRWPVGIRPPAPDRPRLAVLAWDAASSDLAERTRRIVQDQRPDSAAYSLGTLTVPGWTPATTLDIGSVLDEVDLAVVVADPNMERSNTAVRSLLPWSLGVRSVTVMSAEVDRPVSHPGVSVGIGQLAHHLASASSTLDPDLLPWSADAQASGLIATIDRFRTNERLRQR